MHFCSQWIAREMVKTKIRNGRLQENLHAKRTSACFHALLLPCSAIVTRSTSYSPWSERLLSCYSVMRFEVASNEGKGSDAFQ
ncbi:hypothetical protein PVAP13_9KG310740 [Panicum virgatum]|uniref:Uncharacterized protein n=1 Tax=Panicum virgatum TaxID=38727 RepID=A0A8T0N9B6_PANVG|nr:hypothetical protein PVAP13_9KG310740 [Panicum virgatum]